MTKTNTYLGSCLLHVNIDHVATLRNARGTHYPDPVRAAQTCLDAGADGITIHLREDRRHIGDADVANVGGLLREYNTHEKKAFNLEMAATDEMVQIALKSKPTYVTLVPERRQERTTEGGLDVLGGGAALRARVQTLLDAGIPVSLFVAPDMAQLEASAGTGARQVELHTGAYAQDTMADEYIHAKNHEVHTQVPSFVALQRGTAVAHSLGLAIAAGHGLTTHNVPALMQIEDIGELNIGHALIADSVFVGLHEAVSRFRYAMRRAPHSSERRSRERE